VPEPGQVRNTGCGGLKQDKSCRGYTICAGYQALTWPLSLAAPAVFDGSPGVPGSVKTFGMP